MNPPRSVETRSFDRIESWNARLPILLNPQERFRMVADLRSDYDTEWSALKAAAANSARVE